MDVGAQTIPNFLKHYGNNIVGGSLGHHLLEVNIIVAFCILIKIIRRKQAITMYS